MYKLYRHKLYREQIVSAQIVSAQFVSTQTVSVTNCIGHKLYRAQMVSGNKLYRGTNCIGHKLYRAQIVSSPFHFLNMYESILANKVITNNHVEGMKDLWIFLQHFLHII
jgi:hypothetical protein